MLPAGKTRRGRPAGWRKPDAMRAMVMVRIGGELLAAIDARRGTTTSRADMIRTLVRRGLRRGRR